jgi:hypothetical protein
LSAVVRPMAARGWLKCLDVREDATALPVSCAQSASSHVSVPSIAWLPPTAATVGRSRRTGFEFSRSNGLTRLGPPTPQQIRHIAAKMRTPQELKERSAEDQREIFTRVIFSPFFSTRQ